MTLLTNRMSSSSNRLRYDFCMCIVNLRIHGRTTIYNCDNSVTLLLIQSFERMFSGMNSKSQALEAENSELREAICLPDIQVFCVQYVCACTYIYVVTMQWCTCVCACLVEDLGMRQANGMS